MHYQIGKNDLIVQMQEKTELERVHKTRKCKLRHGRVVNDQRYLNSFALADR